MEKINHHISQLIADIKIQIEETKQLVAVSVSSGTSILYWHIGSSISSEILKDKRAEYGLSVIREISNNLTLEYGKGWSEKQLRHCIRVAETFPVKEKFYALSRQLTWTHLRTVMYIKDDIQREFYIQMTVLEKWNTRTLSEKINSLLFERTALSKKPDELIKQELDYLKVENKLTPELVFKDPYFLNFLNLQDHFSERNLEEAILRQMENFILELGQGFTFVERQKSLKIDGEDFKLDLLFYHRKLKRLIAIELKLGKFKAQFKGQMELYLRYLQKYEMEEGEKPPLGLILCSEGSKEQIELLELEKSGIRVAEYLLQLPSREVLKKKLKKVISIEKDKFNKEEYRKWD